MAVSTRTGAKVYSGTVSFGFPKLLLNLHITYADGSTAEIVSDGSWKLAANGPILANNDSTGNTTTRARNSEAGAKRALMIQNGREPKWFRSRAVFFLRK